MVITDPVVFPREGNPHWPLPANYESLEPEDKRIARINAASLSGGELGVHGWMYFCETYLKKRLGRTYDPMFYKPPLYPMGPLHVKLIQSWESDARSAWACPRGSGKSTTMRSYLIWKLVTKQQYEINLFKLKDEFVSEDIQRIREQLDSNEYIKEDFGVQRGDRGEGIWSLHTLQTVNRNWIRGFGIEAGKRGPRASFTILDDVEKDPRKSTMTDEDREELKKMVLQVVVPMLDDGCNMSIIGTNIHPRSFLYHVVNKNVEEGESDTRFRDELWFKALVDVETTDGKNAWPAKFTKRFLANKRETMGEALYAREYLNRPGSDADKPFIIRPGMHHYSFEGDFQSAAPFDSIGTITYHDVDGPKLTPVLVPRTASWQDWLSTLYRFITVDYAYTTSAMADWSVAHVLGMDARGTWFSLEVYKDKLPFPILVDRIWNLSLKWRAQVVGAEAFPIQEEWFNQITSKGDELRDRYHYVPPCVPIQPPPQMEKGAKILRLQHRIEKGLLKLPTWRFNEAGYRALNFQLAEFTEDLGNLKKDDEIDTLSLAHDLIKGGKPVHSGPAAPQTNIERLIAGETMLEGTDIPLALCIDWRTLDATTRNRLISTVREQRWAEAQEERRNVWSDAHPEGEWEQENAFI